MELAHYRILISNLPVREQSFFTKRTNWQEAENQIEWLKEFNDHLFRDNKTLKISRKDIFETNDLRELIIKTIYWGYSNGMRGNNFINILKNIELLENTLNKLRQTQNPTFQELVELNKTLKTILGLGLSTFSKLLYFLQITFNNNPCLILDQKLITVFSQETFSEYKSLKTIKYNNAQQKYLDFLQLTNEISKRLETKGENIEQFLYIFGNNLKSKNEL